MLYDLFYVSAGIANKENWLEFKSRFPGAQLVENVSSFEILKKKSFTKMFWVVWEDIKIRDDFDFSYSSTKWDETYIHVFKNGQFFDSVCLFPKSAKIMQREWHYRFFTNKKEVDIVASSPINYDIVFISYDESFATKNFKKLTSVINENKIYRVHGVKGIHQAHIEAAKKVSTNMFYVVDADAHILSNFKFDYQIPYYDFNAKDTVHVWRSKNPINDLEYGYGGIKLLPTNLTLNMDLSKPDMTTSISKHFKPMPIVSNVTAFNTDPFNTWKSAFRECAKLASQVIDRQKSYETDERLKIWCSVGEDKPFGKYAILGASEGTAFGLANKGNLEEIKKINNFDWLKEQYASRHTKD
jgi:hypothetical protein